MIQRALYTVQEYFSLPGPERSELIDGEIIVPPSPNADHQWYSGRLFKALDDFVMDGGLGRVFYSPFDVVLSERDVVQPDLFFISNERRHIVTRANIQGAPDLVIEILSPSTAALDRGRKLALYSRSGVKEYWLVDPDARSIQILVSGEGGLSPHAAYGEEDTLASPLLPGLALPLAKVFVQ